MDLTGIITLIQNAGADNLRTSVVILAVVLSQFFRKSSLEYQVKNIRKSVDDISSKMKLYVYNPRLYKAELIETYTEGLQYFKDCEKLKNVLTYKMEEFINTIMQIHHNDWKTINKAYVIDLLTIHNKKVFDYIESELEGCQCAEYYKEKHTNKMNKFILNIITIINDPVNSKDKKLQVKAIDFIQDSIRMFFDMKSRCNIAKK